MTNSLEKCNLIESDAENEKVELGKFTLLILPVLSLRKK